MGTTLLMTLIGCVLGFVLGFGIVLLRQTPGLFWAPVRLVAIGYVEFFRRIPFLVILYLVLFFIQAFTPDASLFAIAVIGICLLSIAYTAEIIRTGLESVPRQQIEAGDRHELQPLAALSPRDRAAGLAGDPAAGLRLHGRASSRTRRWSRRSAWSSSPSPARCSTTGASPRCWCSAPSSCSISPSPIP